MIEKIESIIYNRLKYASCPVCRHNNECKDDACLYCENESSHFVLSKKVVRELSEEINNLYSEIIDENK